MPMGAATQPSLPLRELTLWFADALLTNPAEIGREVVQRNKKLAKDRTPEQRLQAIQQQAQQRDERLRRSVVPALSIAGEMGRGIME